MCDLVCLGSWTDPLFPQFGLRKLTKVSSVHRIVFQSFCCSPVLLCVVEWPLCLSYAFLEQSFVIPVEVGANVTDCCICWCSSQRSYNVSVFSRCRCPWFTSTMLLSSHLLSSSGHSRLLYLLHPSFFYLLQNSLIFSHRLLTGLHVGFSLSNPRQKPGRRGIHRLKHLANRSHFFIWTILT